MREPNPQALIDVSHATTQPERLAMLMTKLAEDLKTGHGLEETLGQLDSIAKSDYEITQKVACDLVERYIPNHQYLATRVGGLYANLKDEDPRFLTTRCKEGASLAAKIALRSEGLPIVFQTSQEKPEGTYTVEYALGDLQGIRVVSEDYDTSRRMMDDILADKSLTVVKTEEHKGGNSGEYFASHADILVDGIRVELQLMDLQSFERQDKDEYHGRGKYQLPGEFSLAQMETRR